MWTAIAFIIGAIIAAPIGFLACAILTCGKNAELDRDNNELRCAMFDHCENQCEGDARDACYSCQIFLKRRKLDERC